MISLNRLRERLKAALREPSINPKSQDTAAGEGAVGLKQLRGDINPLALRCLAVVRQGQLVKVRQHNWRQRNQTGVRGTEEERVGVKICIVYIHSSLNRGSAFGPTLPNVRMISMCREC